MSRYRGKLVFPDPELTETIEQKKLFGRLLNVELELGRSYHTAKASSTQPLEVVLPPTPNYGSLQIPPKLRPVVLVDGPNFTQSLKRLSSAFSPMATIDLILGGCSPQLVNFYICWEAAQGKHYITAEGEWGIRKAAETGRITIVEREKKVILVAGPRNPTKTDIDNLLIGDASQLLYQKPSPGGLVLFAGDSDYSDVVSRWLGVGRHTTPTGKPVWIVSTAKSLSRELRQFTEDSALANLLLLEDALMPRSIR